MTVTFLKSLISGLSGECCQALRTLRWTATLNLGAKFTKAWACKKPNSDAATSVSFQGKQLAPFLNHFQHSHLLSTSLTSAFYFALLRKVRCGRVVAKTRLHLWVASFRDWENIVLDVERQLREYKSRPSWLPQNKESPLIFRGRLTREVKQKSDAQITARNWGTSSCKH